MSDQIFSLWPSQIKPKIQSPITILKIQAEALARQTGGILGAKISRKEVGGDKIILSFDILVPALHEFRQRIMNVGHAKDLYYPCIVDAECFSYINTVYSEFIDSGYISRGADNAAENDEEFLGIIRTVLESSEVVSVAQSLIARANDTLAEEGVDER